MTHDDDMREIEAALDTYLCEGMEKPNLLALIRAKLATAKQTDDEWLQAPLTEREKASAELAAKVAEWLAEVADMPADAKHEAKVKAWRDTITACRLDGLRTETGFSVYGMPYVVIEDGVRLMRARPAAITWPSPTPAVDYAYEKAVAKEKAAGELLRATVTVTMLRMLKLAKEAMDQRRRYCVDSAPTWDAEDALVRDTIEAFERAGVK